jgi:hypothetical protein
MNIQAKEIIEDETTKGMLNMFVAWSAREKKMTLLSSRNDGMRFEVIFMYM